MVGVAEEVEVIEQGIEVVEVATLGIAGVQRTGFLIGIIEFAGETAEELSHSEIDLAVADADGRIDKDGFTGGPCHDVAAPEVAVEQGGKSWFDEMRF